LQLKQALKDAEAAKAIQSSASDAHNQIQKAEQAAKLSFIKQSIAPHKAYPSYPSAAPVPWNTPFFAPKPIGHQFHSY
jgi:hypothetical protein